MIAAEKGDTASVKSLLDKGADPNARVFGTWLNYTPLHEAMAHNHRDTAEVLFEYGADPYLEDQNGDPALVYGADKDNEALLKLLLEWKVPIDSKNSKGVTAISRQLSSTGDVQVLLKYGADPNQRADNGETLLIFAAQQETDASTKVLIKAGAQLDLQDSNGNTALIHAFNNPYGNHGSVKALVEAGANVNLQNKEGLSPLICAIPNKEFVRLLLDHGADVKPRTKNERTTLMNAAAFGQMESASLLIQLGVDVNARDHDGNSALHFAAAYSSRFRIEGAETPRKVITLLLEAGADLKAKNNREQTILYAACQNGDGETVNFLLEKGLDPNVADIDGFTPLHSAISYFGIRESTSIAKALLAKDAQVNATDKLGRTPLCLAVEKMNRELISLLLLNEASANHTNLRGETPLLLAAKSFEDSLQPPEYYTAIVDVLASSTRLVEASDQNGMTALMWVAASDNSSALNALLVQNPDLNARSKDGRNALMWAAAAGATYTIEVLLNRGADLEAKDHAGRTARDWASWMDQKQALALLDGKSR